jgi:ABC-type transport system substrate-binding protein
VVALALAIVTAGCGGSDAGSPAGGSASSRILTVATGDDVKSLDPALAFDTWSTAVVHAFTRRLVDYDHAGKLVGDVAERWETTEGGRRVTFYLREDAKFGDGTPVRAGHFKAAIERVRDPKTASPGASFYAGITRIETPDDRTLAFRLKQPDPTFPNVMGMTFAAPLQPGRDYSQPGEGTGSGPYLLAEYEPQSRVVLRRNPHDPRAAEWVEEIVVQLRVDSSLQMTRFRNGEVDLLPAVPPAEYARVMQDPGEKDNVVQGVVNQTWYFGMNTARAPWSDTRVRRAALLALDRRRHVQLAGAGQLANGILPPHVPGHDPNRKLPEQNVEEAKRLLADAGYASGVPKTVMWLVQNDQHPRHAEAIQADLAAVGIPVDLRPVVFSEYLSGYRTRADCWYGGWYPDFPDAGNFLEPVLRGGASSNAARYDNPEVNRLLDRAHVTAQGPARRAMYRQVEDILLRDLPWIPLYFEVESRYFRDGVSGVRVHPVWRQVLTGIRK